jgi:putative acetyltransferase
MINSNILKVIYFKTIIWVMNIEIRPEHPQDYRTLEQLTRDAFWNLHVPGCDEHYLLHIMRNHPDYLAELCLVAWLNSEIIGSIHTTRSWLVDSHNQKFPCLTFGPVSVHPQHQRKGVGKLLMANLADKATKLGEKFIVIDGHPGNYISSGFRSSRDYGISNPEGEFPFSLLALKLDLVWETPAPLHIEYSPVFTELDPLECERFDQSFPTRVKAYQYSQTFYAIASDAWLSPPKKQ